MASHIAARGFSWPRPEGISFPGKYHEAIEDIAGLIRVLVTREEVHLNVPNDNYERIVREFLKARRVPLRRVFFHHIPTNEAGRAITGRRSCCGSVAARPKRRSSTGASTRGAASIRRGMPTTAVPTRIAEELKLPVFYPRIVMEGGAVDFNGAGTVMTTTSCLLNKNRNPTGLSKKRIEKYLRDYYGQTHVIWLGEGIEGDDTDGHIDDLARFIDERTIAIGIETNKRDPNYAILQKARRALDKARDQDGNPFEIVELPMPRPIAYDGQRVPATYVNFYFVNGALLVPTFGQRDRDRKAIAILQQHAAETQGDRRRLPQADLGPRRDSLLHAAATVLLTSQRRPFNLPARVAREETARRRTALQLRRRRLSITELAPRLRPPG